MISVAEALNILEAQTLPMNKVRLKLLETLNHVLAEAVVSPADAPPFPQSAMDGYAIALEHTKLNAPIKVSIDIPAGSTRQQKLEPGTAARIYTGAPVPSGANAVVVVEQTNRADDQLIIQPHPMTVGMNIRPQGSHVTKGQLVMDAGSLITPAAAGFLASVGVAEVTVWAKPRVGILVTGSELVPAGSTLEFGQIYESNSIALQAALQPIDIKAAWVAHVQDDPDRMEALLLVHLPETDLLLVTGGVSAGKYDFVLEVMERVGVKTLFHKVKQRPGKPLFAGVSANGMVLGLPGNPASVITCFYRYAVPLLRKYCGLSFSLPTQKLPSMKAVQKKPGLTYFMKAFANTTGVTVLEGQESYKMNAFSEANALAVFDEDSSVQFAGAEVEVILLDHLWTQR